MAEKDLQALELRRAGVALPKIMEQLGYRTRAQCEKAIARELGAQGIVSDPAAVRRGELDRLDRLQAAVWVKAARGDVAAIEKVLRISEARLRLAGSFEASEVSVEAALKRSALALSLDDRDDGLIAAALTTARQIDLLAGTGDPQYASKIADAASKLGSLLRDLGATPAARGEVSAAAEAARIAAPAMDDL